MQSDLLQLCSGKTLSAVVFHRGRFRVYVCRCSDDASCSCNKQYCFKFLLKFSCFEICTSYMLKCKNVPFAKFTEWLKIF